MPLESCMILLDCSEYMRNGDYIPTRLEAQRDAANLLVGAKTQSHPESTVGVSAGTELLVSPTDDVGKLLKALHGLPYKSAEEHAVTSAVQVASLALKHRPNKNGSQRIILFVGTPLDDIETKAMQKAGRQLKKNNVAIDVVAMGELEANEEKLRELVNAANGRTAAASADDAAGERTCHLVTIPAGVLPSDVLASSPILAADGGAYAAAAAGAGAFGAAAGGGGGGEAGGFDFGGVDPNMDPELAMALRVSMEEERVRQERVAAAAAAAAASEETKDAEMPQVSEEDALLQQALAMSMQENDPKPEGAEDEAKPAATAMETDDDDAAMQMALQMSMQQEESTAAQDKDGDDGDKKQQFQDPAFVNELLGSMPGVDPNDPEIQAALKKAKEEEEEKKKKSEDKK